MDVSHVCDDCALISVVKEEVESKRSKSSDGRRDILLDDVIDDDEDVKLDWSLAIFDQFKNFLDLLM